MLSDVLGGGEPVCDIRRLSSRAGWHALLCVASSLSSHPSLLLQSSSETTTVLGILAHRHLPSPLLAGAPWMLFLG